MAQSCNKIMYKNSAQQQIMAKNGKETNLNKFQKKNYRDSLSEKQ